MLRLRLRDEREHRLHFYRPRAGIQLVNQRADLLGDRHRVARRAHRPALRGAVPEEPVGDEERFSSVDRELPVPLVIHDADDLEALRLVRADPHEDRLAYRRLTGVRELREEPVDDHDGAPRALSASVKVRPSISLVLIVSK